ncbi:MAG: PucR family transcriptional regulator [Pseudomonadota bacterium]
MTTVITRYFEDAAQGRAVADKLVESEGFPEWIVRVYETSARLTNTLTEAGVKPEAVKAYAERMGYGGAIVLVRAGYKPLGVARTTRRVLAEGGAVDLGGLNEEARVKEDRIPVPKVLEGQPLLLTRKRDPKSTTFHMANWPIPLLIRSRRKPLRPVIPPHGRMANWPIPLIWRRAPYTGSIIAPHARMANFPIPLLSDRKPYTKSIIPRHGRMANFPIPLLSRRKPYTGSLIPRHQRMATWPFPLLINGKTGTNALIPGGPRMANFPIPLLSGRKPYTGSVIPRHGRMANFPIPLLSRRKPYNEMAIPRHGRMAAFPWPLVIKRDGQDGFSLSKKLGWPTIIRRKPA